MSSLKDIDLKMLHEAILEYRSEGARLMTELGKKYDLDITNPDDYIQLIARNGTIPRRGEISKRWSYSFHGGECGFYNKKHQQSVEVVLTNPPHFGHINSWFLLNYLQSTGKYKSEFEDVSWKDFKVVIDHLHETGEIEYIEA